MILHLSFPLRALPCLLVVLAVLLSGCGSEGQQATPDAPVYSETYPNVPLLSQDSLSAWLGSVYAARPILLESTDAATPGQDGDVISVPTGATDLVFLENVAHDDPIVCFGQRSADPGALCDRLVAAGYQNVALLDGSFSAQDVAALRPSE